MQMGIRSVPARRWARSPWSRCWTDLALVTVRRQRQRGTRGHGEEEVQEEEARSASSATKKKKCKKVHHVVLPAPARWSAPR